MNCCRSGSGVLLQARDTLGARDRDHILALGQDPGEGDLRRCHSFGVSQGLEHLDDLQIRVGPRR